MDSSITIIESRDLLANLCGIVFVAENSAWFYIHTTKLESFRHIIIITI